MKSYKNSQLWAALDNKLYGDRQYLANIEKICNYAIKRVESIRDIFPLFTCHDEIHICNVLNLMANLLGDKINRLNRDETILLILSACFHDIGMSAESDEIEELKSINNPEMMQYLDENPGEYLKAYVDGKKGLVISDVQVRSYIRANHHLRAKKLILNMKWPTGIEEELRQNLIWICQTHGESCEAVENSCPYSAFADLRLCAVLLRLADILDFDTSRAPQTLYERCGFENAEDYEVLFSKEEWDKHKASHGFYFNSVNNRDIPYELPYRASSPSMQIEQGIRSYLDWVDKELYDCNNLLHKFTGKWSNLALPTKVSRSITPIGYLQGEYHFSLDQSHVLQLLGGEELYSEPSAFVRELLQNAIDAVRTRAVLDQNLPQNWKPQINIHTWTDMEGYDWFRIEDNGIGMTEETIQKHLLKIGSSYYNSNEFKKEKLRNEASVNYMPISRFGIGILSCFMGDIHKNRVEISTKHYGSAPLHGLRLHMQGLTGYYAMYSRESYHTPDVMPGLDPEECVSYRNEPGTIVAVRTRLYRTGKFSGFKEIVDSYVIYSPVPIHYDGLEGSCDYVTEQEFMDVIHKIAPSEDRAKDGVSEFPLSQEQLDELKNKWPEMDLSDPPRLLLKCAALDRYTKSQNLTGAIVATGIIGKIPPFNTSLGDKTAEIRVKTKIDVKEEALGFTFKLSFNNNLLFPEKKIDEIKAAMKSLYQKALNRKESRYQFYFSKSNETIKAICRNEIIKAIYNNQIYNPQFNKRLSKEFNYSIAQIDEMIDKVWRKIQRDVGVNKEEWQEICLLKRIEKTAFLKIIDLDSIPWYKQYIKSVIINTGSDSLTVHNGIRCGNASFINDNHYGIDNLGIILLLNDKYRPKLSLARDEILGLSLETSFDCEMILRQLKKEGFIFGSASCLKTIEKEYAYLPASDYFALLKNRPDWCEQLTVKTNLGVFPVDELPITEQIEINTESLPDYKMGYNSNGLYGHFLTSYLQAYYTLIQKQDKYSFDIRLLNSKPLQGDYSRKVFPPALFLPVENDLRKWLSKEYYSLNPCNTNHRFSQFLINHFEEIKRLSPGSLHRFIVVLTIKYGKEAIELINAQLKLLQNIPGNPIGVTDDLFLNDSDIVQ